MIAVGSVECSVDIHCVQDSNRLLDVDWPYQIFSASIQSSANTMVVCKPCDQELSHLVALSWVYITFNTGAETG
jgi:hypothetical protein